MIVEFEAKCEDRHQKRKILEHNLNEIRKKYSFEVNRLIQKESNEIDVCTTFLFFNCLFFAFMLSFTK